MHVERSLFLMMVGGMELDVVLTHVVFAQYPVNEEVFFFSNLGQFLEINDFLTQYNNGKGKKDLHFRYNTHIKRTSKLWQAIWGADIFSTKKSKMASGSLFFTKSAILPIFDPILQREGRKRSGLKLYHPYGKNLTSVASYLGS